MTAAAPHIPVMIGEVLAALSPHDGEIYIDGTFGAGGYTAAILDAADCRVIAIDRDSGAIAAGQALAGKYEGRLHLVHGNFGDVLALAQAAGCARVNGMVLDIGVSSMQIDRPERGFSFRFDGPLDMRMDPQSGGSTAADIVNNTEEEDLANLIYKFGEERHSRRIARAIVAARTQEPVVTTLRLAEIVRGAIPFAKKDAIDPATRTFQALRITVNDELGELERALAAAESLLAEGGRLVIVSFHSLEDGIVKKFMRERSGNESRGSRYFPETVIDDNPSFTLPSRKAVFPSPEECAANPRARSARLRVAIRTGSPAMKRKPSAAREAHA